MLTGVKTPRYFSGRWFASLPVNSGHDADVPSGTMLAAIRVERPSGRSLALDRSLTREGTESMSGKIPCPFVYANGKRCTGEVVRVEAYKADITWGPGDDGKWRPAIGQPRSHYHLFCSEKDNHAGYARQDDGRMKFYFDQLPADLRAAML
jgi:hypothetical protein